MTQEDTVVARASGLFLRRGEQPADEIWTSPVTMPPLPPTPDPIPRRAGHAGVDLRQGRALARDPASGSARGSTPGPKYIWVRDIRPLVEGQPLTPFTRAAMAGDMASSLTHYGPSGLQFINADYTLTLSRLPRARTSAWPR